MQISARQQQLLRKKREKQGQTIINFFCQQRHSYIARSDVWVFVNELVALFARGLCVSCAVFIAPMRAFCTIATCLAPDDEIKVTTLPCLSCTHRKHRILQSPARRICDSATTCAEP